MGTFYTEVDDGTTDSIDVYIRLGMDSHDCCTKHFRQSIMQALMGPLKSTVPPFPIPNSSIGNEYIIKTGAIH